MAIINGTNLIIYEIDTPMGHTTTGVLNLTMDLSDATTKDSGGWYEAIAGKSTAKLSAEGLVDYADQFGYEQWVDRMITKTKTMYVFKSSTRFYFGEGQIVAVEETADMEGGVKCSVEIDILGRVYWEDYLPWNLIFENWENINQVWENVSKNFLNS